MIKNFTSLCCLILVFAVSSCKKSETPVAVDTSFLSVINASTSVGTYNLYLNNQRANSAALPIGAVINYFEVNAGAYDIKFTTASSTESLFSKKHDLQLNTGYSFFLVGRPGQLESVLTTDVMSIGNEKASIRFANMAPDAPALSLTTVTTVVEETGKEIVSDKAYKTVSDFVTMDAKAFTFEVREKATGKIIATLPNTTLVAGKYYTIMVRGMINPDNTEHPVGVQLITNL